MVFDTYKFSFRSLLLRLLSSYLLAHSAQDALSITLSFTKYFLFGLFSSLSVYRMFISPLRRFPGPVGARISNLWLSAQLWKLDSHKKPMTLHEKYGDYVCIGSCDLSIADPKALEIIYGPLSQCIKADWYDLTHPIVSMQTTRDRALHSARRRLWSAAFRERSIRAYGERIQPYQEQLLCRLDASHDKAVNITQWSKLYNFDVMGDLAFGKSFDMLKTSQDHCAKCRHGSLGIDASHLAL